MTHRKTEFSILHYHKRAQLLRVFASLFEHGYTRTQQTTNTHLRGPEQMQSVQSVQSITPSAVDNATAAASITTTLVSTVPAATHETADEDAPECASCYEGFASDEEPITGIGCACPNTYFHLACLEEAAKANFYNQSSYKRYKCCMCCTTIAQPLACGVGKFANGDPTIRSLYGNGKPLPKKSKKKSAPVLPSWVHQVVKGTELKMRPTPFKAYCKSVANELSDANANAVETPANVFRMTKAKATATGYLWVQHVGGGDAPVRRKFNAFSGVV